MLLGMQSSTICPKCGLQMVDGACPACAASGTPDGSSSLQWDYVFAAVGYVFLVLLYFGITSLRSTMAGERLERRQSAEVTAARKGSPIARLDQLKGSGRIYLVQMGEHHAPYSLNGFAEWLHAKYGLDVEILPPIDLRKGAWDSGRRQYVAELLTDQLKREHPSLVEDPQAYLIGFTDADMYPVDNDWRFTFTWRDRPRTAVISTHRMQDSLWARMGEDKSVAEGRFQARLRRILLKDVAILYWHLPMNHDPASVLQNGLDPDLPLEDIYESDLHPERTRWGRFEGEPCIFFRYSPKEGVQPLPGALIRSCTDVEDDAIRDDSQELFEVDLRLGLLIDRHTDFYLPDTIPIQFERATREGWRGPDAFGITGTHSYNRYLGSSDGMRTVDVYCATGVRFGLRRVPSWLAMLSLVKYVDTDYSGRMYELRWRSARYEHFELKNYKGEVASYLPCSAGTPPCYENGFRNSKGEALVFERDDHRRLMRLESPNRKELRFSYDDAGRISEIADSKGRKVDYSYDDRGRLVKVTYPSGEVLSYEYDSTQHLLTFSVAPDAKAKPVALLRNEYDNGKIVRQTFGNQSYLYSYEPGAEDSIRSATVRTPHGTVYDVSMCDNDCSAVRERGSTANPENLE